MHRVSVLLACLAMTAATVVAESELEFGEPLHFGDAGTAYGVEWFLAVDRSSTGELIAAFDADGPGSALVTNMTFAYASHSYAHIDHLVSEGARNLGAIDPGTLTLEGAGPDHMTIFVTDATASLWWNASGVVQVHAAGACLSDLLQAVNRPEGRYGTFCPEDRGPMVIVEATEAPFEFTANGQTVTRLEYQGLTTSCTNGDCPPSAMAERTTVPVPGGVVELRNYSYVDYRPGGGELIAEGSATLLVLGGQRLDLHVEGWARLPAVEGVPACADCDLAGNETLWANGSLDFKGLRADPSEDRFQASLSGDVRSARLDEAALDPSVLGKASIAAAGIGLGVLAWKLGAAALFHRVTPERALDHPRRKRIVAYVEERPGATFREVSRATDMSAGTLRHHLNVLCRVKLLVERPHRATVRVFPNHGKYDDTWNEVVLLRDEALAEVHAFVDHHPSCIQSRILEHFEAQGWSRSTTQHRLQRLVDGGLVDAVPRGRRKLYSVRPPPKKVGTTSLAPLVAP